MIKKHKYQLISDGIGMISVISILAGIGMISFFLMEMRKNLIELQRKEKASKDIELSAQKLKTLFLTPYHCNANLLGKAVPSATIVNGFIYRCTNRDCNPVSGNIANYFPIGPYGAISSGFELDINDQGDTDTARIKSIKYEITTPQDITASPNAKAATLTITVEFEKNYGRTLFGVYKLAQVNQAIVFKFDAYVRTATDSTNTTILGCVKDRKAFAIYDN